MSKSSVPVNGNIQGKGKDTPMQAMRHVLDIWILDKEIIYTFLKQT